MFTTYYDESGRTDRTFTLAAWVVSDEVRASFEARWNEILAKAEVEVLHMRDYSHGRGEFADLSKDERVKLLSDLIDVIVDLRLCGASVHFTLADYDQFLLDLAADPEIALRPRSPYHIGLQYIAAACAYYLPRTRGKGPIAHLLSHHPNETASATNRYLELKSVDEFCGFTNYGPLAIGVPRDHVGLQAADLLAYETDLRYCRRLFEPSVRPMRESMRRLDKLVVPTEFERSQWMEFCTMYKQAKKDGFLVFPAA